MTVRMIFDDHNADMVEKGHNDYDNNIINMSL